MQRVRGIVSDFRDGSTKRLERAGVHVVHARARFTGERTVAGGDIEVTAPVIVINAGATTAVPATIEGLADVPFLTNDTFFSLTSLPRRTLIIGGGYIGLELGQGLARCGSEVRIFSGSERVLEREEMDASMVLLDALREDGVLFHLGAMIHRASKTSDGGVLLECDDGAQFEGDAMLVATGRKGNTTDLHPEASGVEMGEHGFVRVDDYLRTTCDGIFAIGDCSGQPQFTHVSWEDHRRILSTLRGEPRKRDDRVLGYAVFTEPQVGRVGLTLEQAQQRGIDARAKTFQVANSARGIEWNEPRGFYRMVVDNATDKIIGATLAGYEAGELVHVFLAHMEAGSTWQVLARSVHIHPTFCESMPGLAEQFGS